MSHPSSPSVAHPPGAGASPTPAQLAKAALSRLALSKREPTPENYAQAWAEELGQPAPGTALPARARPVLERALSRLGDDPALRVELLANLAQGHWEQAQRQAERLSDQMSQQAQQWAQLIERLTRGLARSSRSWSSARRKDSLERVLQSSGSDASRLQRRLAQLLQAWDSETDLSADSPAAAEPAPAEPELAAATAAGAGPSLSPGTDAVWPQLLQPLAHTVGLALPDDARHAVALADELAALAQQVVEQGATPALVQAVQAVCERAGKLLSHRHHLMRQVHRLSQALADSLAEVCDEDSWVQGQMLALRDCLGDAPSARGVDSAHQLLAHSRERQRGLRGERDQARQALRVLIQRMLAELAELDQHTGRFHDGLLGHAQTIAHAESLAELTGVVRALVDDTQAVHGVVSATRERLSLEHDRASALEQRVRELEGELRRVSEELCTDVLTQVANRRGLQQRFEQEQARLQRHGGELAIGLLDIDNFKKLNDNLGHAAGDQALVMLAQQVQSHLRAVDLVARFGGEEFVVLLPDTAVEAAQHTLTRLQRSLSASLFMHEAQEVLVTFSAGVTAYRADEPLQDALERADLALYEAKRTGKNRTCLG